MRLGTAYEISLHDAMEGLERLSAEAGLTSEQLSALLASDLDIEHLLAYLDAAAAKQMN